MDLLHLFKVSKKEVSCVVNSMSSFLQVFSSRGTKTETLRIAREHALTMLCWSDNVSYRDLCKELNLSYATYRPLLEKAKIRSIALKKYELKGEKGQSKGAKKGVKKGTKNGAKKDRNSSAIILSRPQFYRERNKRKDATDARVIEHARNFFFSISTPISSKAKHGKKRMDVVTKDAYKKWLMQVKMPVVSGGLNMPSTFSIALSTFLKARPSDVLTLGRDYGLVGSDCNM